MTTAALQIVPIDSDGEPLVLDPASAFVVGRATDAAIVLDDPQVSRHHARIEFRDGAWKFVDTSGGNGSWIDGVHIAPDEDAEIHEGTSIRIGPRHFVVRGGGMARDNHQFAGPSPSERPEDSPRLKSDDPYRTHESIFLRLRADGTLDRQMGWNEFHSRYAPVVAGFARNAGLSAGEIDDVVQDVMFGFFRVSNAFVYDPSRGRFRGYLKRITLNAIRDRWRKRRKEAPMPAEFDPEQEDPMDRRWEKEWSESLLRRAMEEVRMRVQPRTMQAFEMYGVQGMAPEVVERETGMTYAAIRHAKMRVLQDLQAVVRRLRAEEG